MITQAIGGAGYLLFGLRLITRPGIRRFVAIPLLVNILVFSGAIWLGVRQFEQFMALIESRIPGWLGWLDWLLWPLFVVLLLVVVFYTFTLVANLLAAPFNGLLAEQVEAHLNAAPPQRASSWQTLLSALPATLHDELKKLLYAIGWALPFLLLLFVPVIGPPLWFLYTAWMFALEYSDYPMGNHGLKFRQMRACLRANRSLALGFGAATAGLALLPIVNFVLMPAAVAGATAMWVRELGGARSNGARHPVGAHQSQMTTRRVTLLVNHLSGRISGRITAGRHGGAELERLATADLLELLADYYRDDPESAEALEVYLEHQRGERQRARPFSPQPGVRASGISRARALLDVPEAQAILGVGAHATIEDIHAAHRRLMMRLHPDRGGTDYLAARVNEAKDLLTRSAPAR